MGAGFLAVWRCFAASGGAASGTGLPAISNAEMIALASANTAALSMTMRKPDRNESLIACVNCA